MTLFDANEELRYDRLRRADIRFQRQPAWAFVVVCLLGVLFSSGILAGTIFHLFPGGNPRWWVMVCLILLLVYCSASVTWELVQLRSGNHIVVTQEALTEYRVTVFGQQESISLPWKGIDVKVTTPSRGVGLFPFGFSLGELIGEFVFGRGERVALRHRDKPQVVCEFRARTVRDYADLKIVLMLRSAAADGSWNEERSRF